MGSINTDSTTINFNGANIKIATLGKGLIFADGTTLSSNTEIGGGGSSNLQQVVDLGNVTANTLLLENTGKTIVSSGNIESNIITTIIRFQEGSELPDGQGITLESAANNGNTVSNVVQFSNGFTVGSNLVVDEIGTNVIDVTGKIGATLFVGDGGLLSNISGGGGGSQTLQQTTDLGNTTTNVVTFTNGLVSGSDLIVQNDANIVRQIQTTRINYYDRATRAWVYLDNGVYIGGDEIYFMNKADNATIMFIDTTTTNVGIGTTSPSANLHVIGNVHASSDITTNTSLGATDGTDNNTFINKGSIELCRSAGNPFIDFKNQISDDYDFRIIGTNSATGLMFTNNTQNYLSIDDTDKVKIYSNLHVTGTITTDGAVYGCFGGTTVGTQTLTGTASVLSFNTTMENSSTDHFTLSNGVITVKVAGVYSISYNVGTIISSGTNRSDSEAYIGINGTEYTNSRTFMYNRTVGVGENTGSASFVRTLSANDTVAIYILQDAGTSTIIANTGLTQISLYRLN